ncbi:glycosyltransferase [Flavobacterium jejuense]|uniref:Glycogen synthase n=1 Tax=Flavobacterium jejuense TaxID=1544455 RepID=A0ABX0IY89_9FLAO|nr:glycogen/starch synthase [Flavobacterium jejuense]NHN27702.1 glycosyltransferase [Flavobacterium jejuense]
MTIIHVAAECFPVAKVGGLADVVGALPKFQNKNKEKAEVIMPFYNLPFTQKNKFKEIYKGEVPLNGVNYTFRVVTLLKESDFTINFIDIPELLYTDYVYSYDDTIRFLAFQIAVLKWISSWENKPEIIHVHDHHTGLIPFMMTQSYQFDDLKLIPTVFTIHNAQYQGWFSHEKVGLIPKFDFSKVGLLDWSGEINPMAAAIKCAWAVTTVSPSYMEELKSKANGLEDLLKYESGKCVGILNGIDTEVWNPETDEYLKRNYKKTTAVSGKKANKNWLCDQYGFNRNKPLIAFIGRFVHDKGCDLFAEVFTNYLNELEVSILILGSGDPKVQEDLTNLNDVFEGDYKYVSGYNEALSHVIYAGADFLLMPSRVEPCGLNQMYALRYGTVPIVNNVGGLKDTILDYKEVNGFGIVIHEVTVTEIKTAIEEAVQLYNNQLLLKKIKNQIMKIDHSWLASAKEYQKLYQKLKK